jgi:hypothetical protein
MQKKPIPKEQLAQIIIGFFPNGHKENHWKM